MPKAKSIRVPITIENIDGDGFHIFTEIQIGKKTLRALIDTGASKSVMGKKLVGKLKNLEVVSSGESQAKGIGEEMLDSTIARIKKIHLGELEMKNLHVGVLDLSHITKTYKLMGIEPFAMIIGGDILSHFDAVINYKKCWMKLSE